MIFPRPLFYFSSIGIFLTSRSKTNVPSPSELAPWKAPTVSGLPFRRGESMARDVKLLPADTGRDGKNRMRRIRDARHSGERV